MKKILLSLICFFISIQQAKAQNIVLLIADGMGENHIECTAKENKLFLKTLFPKGKITTHSYSDAITDSAASATSYSCGIKTINKYLGLDKDEKLCQTLAELSTLLGYQTIIRTSDVITGATPAAFYAHTNSRYNTKAINAYLKTAQQTMDIKSVEEIDIEAKKIFSNLRKNPQKFFLVIEESETDKQSHNNNLQKMKEALVRFDNTVKEAFSFANENKNTTVIVLADHETGGLTTTCEYTSHNHTASPILYYAFGKYENLFTEPVLDNISINHKIKSILTEQH